MTDPTDNGVAFGWTTVQTVCAICDAPLGTDAQSAYTPYLSHADKSVCVAIIRADERERMTLPEWTQVVADARASATAQTLADLRATVKGLHIAPTLNGTDVVWRSDVLALLEEKP